MLPWRPWRRTAGRGTGSPARMQEDGVTGLWRGLPPLSTVKPSPQRGVIPWPVDAGTE
jgi:hypothetical protein